jgi:hypothetical protein
MVLYIVNVNASCKLYCIYADMRLKCDNIFMEQKSHDTPITTMGAFDSGRVERNFNTTANQTRVV